MPKDECILIFLNIFLSLVGKVCIPCDNAGQRTLKAEMKVSGKVVKDEAIRFSFFKKTEKEVYQLAENVAEYVHDMKDEMCDSK